MARRIDRRELLQGGAGLAIAAGLAGCGVGNSSSGSKEETEKPIKKRVDGDLVYFNYSEYIDPDLVKGFEKRYGVKVRESYFDSMSAMMAKLRAGIEFDVIFPSAEYAQRLIQGNLIRKIDRDRLRNVDTVYEHFDDPWYDPGSEHTTPYSMYMTGLGYRTDKVSGMTGSLARPRPGTQVIVELGPGMRVTALEQNTHRARSDDRWRIGDRVRLGWRREHARVLR